MTRVYKITYSDSQPFMSVKTFIGWFFGWLSAFKIDFRKEIDPYCHVGCSMRSIQVQIQGFDEACPTRISNKAAWCHIM